MPTIYDELELRIVGSIISSGFGVGRASSLKPKNTGKLKRVKSGSILVNEHRPYIQGDFLKVTRTPPPPTTIWPLQIFLCDLWQRILVTGVNFAQSWNLQKFTWWGRDGASSPKRWENHYSVIRHFEGLGKTKTINRPSIFYFYHPYKNGDSKRKMAEK